MDQKRIPLEVVLATNALGSHMYEAHLPLDHCYKTTAYGGSLVSMIMSATQLHFATTLSRQKQPHTFDLHLVFLRPATNGKVALEIEDVKLGAGVSTIRITLSQRGKACLTGHVSNTNLSTPLGPSLPTHFSLHPSPTPAHLPLLASNTDSNWTPFTYPSHPASTMQAFTHLIYHFPTHGTSSPSISDCWLTPLNPTDTFTPTLLPFVIDAWHRTPENFRPNTPLWGTSQLATRALHLFHDSHATGPNDLVPGAKVYAYPTFSMSLEVKKVLPVEGVKWLFVRARTKMVENGRMDAEVVVMDEGGGLVAVSQQVGFVVERGGEGEGEGNGKGGGREKEKGKL
ncbi:MAG: hypothetical protein Q9220_005461 [cf. Caloplaca sp. 1 TL-2023]